mgnify:CR=1 FL=1
MWHRNGFSLLEILIALVFIACAFLPIYNAFSVGSQGTASNINENIATNYASDMINFLKDLSYDQIDKCDSSSDLEFKNDEETQAFFNKMNLKSPPTCDEPFVRSVKIHKFDRRSLIEWFTDLWAKRTLVTSYLATVTVTFPKTTGKGNDDVTLFSLILD